MGLDMYLFKTKRVEGITPEQYDEIEGKLPYELEEFIEGGGLTKMCPDIQNIKELADVLRVTEGPFSWLTIMDKIGYWRKANQIHNWFVENCQNGIDECQMVEVTKEHLETLLKICKETLELKDCENKLEQIEKTKGTLPTKDGFFFGSTSIDEYYFDAIEDTIKQIEETLEKVDFEKEIVLYQSSW